MKDMAYTARGVNVVTSVYRETDGDNYCCNRELLWEHLDDK